MASTCMRDCINDAVACPIRPTTYVSIHRWPESEAKFIMRTVSNRMDGNLAGEGGRGERNAGGGRLQPRVVDCISCRQMYLRSYTFSRKESVQEKTKKCVEIMKERAAAMMKSGPVMASTKRKVVIVKSCRKAKVSNGKWCDHLVKVKEVSCDAFRAVFIRLLSCTAKVDVADDHDHHHKD